MTGHALSGGQLVVGTTLRALLVVLLEALEKIV